MQNYEVIIWTGDIHPKNGTPKLNVTQRFSSTQGSQIDRQMRLNGGVLSYGYITLDSTLSGFPITTSNHLGWVNKRISEQNPDKSFVYSINMIPSLNDMPSLAAPPVTAQAKVKPIPVTPSPPPPPPPPAIPVVVPRVVPVLPPVTPRPTLIGKADVLDAIKNGTQQLRRTSGPASTYNKENAAAKLLSNSTVQFMLKRRIALGEDVSDEDDWSDAD